MYRFDAASFDSFVTELGFLIISAARSQASLSRISLNNRDYYFATPISGILHIHLRYFREAFK